MNRKLLMLAAAAGAAFIFAADQPRKEPDEFLKLKAKVELLEGRIARLESRLNSVTPRVGLEDFSLSPGAQNLVPPNIGELEVNGLKVYKVPLAHPPE